MFGAVQIGEHDPCPVGVEPAGEGRSDAARGPGDDDMTVTQLHGWIVRSERRNHERMHTRAIAVFRVRSLVMTDQDTAPSGTVDPDAEQAQREAVVADAVTVIDEALTKMMQRELMSSNEVADILLDVRMLLTSR